MGFNSLTADGPPATTVANLLTQLDRKESEGSEGLPQGSVLLVDEAGMVDSATLARLVSYAEAAQAKLVLVGDPEQLGEIEAGGLFRAVADRSEPIPLCEVIRHEHQLDREAARRIREGEGGGALRLYMAENRVTIAPNAAARREAMVRDWQESFERGEDAMMIAKQNTEVARLNELAREVRRQAGHLGGEEIEIGEARFAAGDQVITRVNDQRAEVFNRERWQIAEAEATERRVVLDGIDQAKRVELGAEYLVRTNPYNDAPALEHAYAVTTYSAQGSTVDQALVAADPSMDKQELYVATSRSRGETHLYATPEVQSHREEIAPSSPYLREGLPHIAEASERDRAQLAAHEVVLRSRFNGLPTEELVARHRELRGRPTTRPASRSAATRSRSESSGATRASTNSASSAKQRRRCRGASDVASWRGSKARRASRASSLSGWRPSWPRCRLPAMPHGGSSRSPIRSSPSAYSSRSPPPASLRRSTSRPSWAIGRAIGPSARHGIAASLKSSATASSTASKTRTEPLERRRSTAADPYDTTTRLERVSHSH